MGNEAICEGAIAAGVRFYAGYPITPATEIAEYMSRRMPEVAGKYVQMEDEIGSIYAVMGASGAGARAMTATSGPGIGLMQEGIGSAAAMEIPLVVVVVSRPGPGAGDATGSGQCDVMQARYGPNGDNAVIALTPSTVAESFWLTIKAVNLAERFRTPVILLTEGLLGHMREVVDLPDYGKTERVERPRPSGPPEKYETYALHKTDEISPMADFGSKYRSVLHYVPNHVYGGRTGQDALKFTLNHFHAKIESRRDEITMAESLYTDDAEVLFVAYGTQARSAHEAMDRLRARGKKAGLLRLITLWPFPYEQVRQAARAAKVVLVPEMNTGQVQGEVLKALRRHPAEVLGVNHLHSDPIAPEEILDKLTGVL